MLSSICRSASPAAEGRDVSPALALATAWLGLMIFVSLFAPLIAPYGYAEQDLLARLQPPSRLGGAEGHLFGTDHLGRDVFSRALYAVRISMAVALIGAVVGTALGALAAHFRGAVEEAIMGLVDVQASLPFLIFALLVIALFGNDLFLLILLVGFQGWEKYARLVRALVLDARTRDMPARPGLRGCRPGGSTSCISRRTSRGRWRCSSP